MMRQRQIARQGVWLLSEFFVFPLLLTEQLLGMVQLIFCLSEFLTQPLNVGAEFATLCR